MASYPAPARRCLDLAAAAAPALVERVVDAAVASLQQSEMDGPAGAQRQELAQAWLALLQRRADWAGRYPGLLAAAMDRPAQAAPAARENRDAVLALVDEDDLVQRIEASRLTQLLASRLERPLAELDALMSSALGLANVQPERNPLRPEVFAQAFRTLMQQDGQQEQPGLWTRHLAEPLGAELQTLYGRVLALLQDADLQAASYRVLPVAGTAPIAARAAGGAPGGTAATGPTGATGAAGAAVAQLPAARAAGPALAGPSWADLSRHELGDELFQHFLLARTQPSSQRLAPSYYAEVEQQLAALEADHDATPYDAGAALRHRELAPVERPHRAVDTASPLDDAVWGRWGRARERTLVRTQLKKQARDVGQVLGLEVVRKLLDQVGRDPRLLAPVREAIVALEPALLRLALVAPRFFTEAEHAGRRLVERVAERSFKYNDEFAADFQAFFAEVRACFQALNDSPVEDDAPFAGALRQLEGRWATQDELEAPGRQVAVDAMYFAEAREAEAGRIAWTLSQRSDLEDVPAVVQDFLYGPWSLVMAHARLAGKQREIDPGGWTAVVPDLLWSVKRDQTLRNPARLIATIPVLLERLRAGLALVGQEPREHATFFNALEKLHRPVLKLRARQRQSGDSMPAALEVDAALLSTARQQPRRDAAEPWMAQEEQDAAGFLDTLPSAPAPLGADPAMQGEAGDSADTVTAAEAQWPLDEAGVAAMVDGLRQGSWVDLYARRRWRRASLTWVNNRATLFMFVSGGGRPHSMTRRILERLVRDRMLRPVDAGQVVTRAIEQLSQRRERPQALAA